MKKLMIAFAVVALATVSQAANWKWSLVNVYDGTGATDNSNKYNGRVYLFDAGLNSQQAVYDLLLAETDIAGMAITSTEVVNGLVNINSSTSSFVYGEGGTKYGFYAVILNGDKAYFSNIKEVTANITTTAASLPLGTQNNNSTTFSATAPTGDGFQGSGRWSAVPEPTGAMLIVLGVAALALRRKRA